MSTWCGRKVHHAKIRVVNVIVGVHGPADPVHGAARADAADALLVDDRPHSDRIFVLHQQEDQPVGQSASVNGGHWRGWDREVGVRVKDPLQLPREGGCEVLHRGRRDQLAGALPPPLVARFTVSQRHLPPDAGTRLLCCHWPCLPPPLHNGRRLSRSRWRNHKRLPAGWLRRAGAGSEVVRVDRAVACEQQPTPLVI